MGKVYGIALGAGVASALLFIVSATASLAAVVLAYLTPLPIMIAALGFGHLSGGLAAFVGAGAVALALGPVPALTFIVVLGLPAWWLSYVSLLARPAPVAPDGAVEWYPVGKIVIWIAGLAAAPVLVIGVALMLRFGGYGHAVSVMSSKLQAMFAGSRLPGNLPYEDLVKVIPLAMAASTFLMLAFNLWLSGRIVLVSQKLARPWPDLADGLRLPRRLVTLFLVLLGCALLPGPAGVAAGCVAAAIAMAFVFEGLAAAHVVTRGLLARRLILCAIYGVVVFLMPWPLLALALLGCLDSLFPVRGHPLPRSPKPPSRS